MDCFFCFSIGNWFVSANWNSCFSSSFVVSFQVTNKFNESFDKYLDHTYNPHLDSMNRFNYRLLTYVRDLFNFRYTNTHIRKFRVTASVSVGHRCCSISLDLRCLWACRAWIWYERAYGMRQVCRFTNNRNNENRIAEKCGCCCSIIQFGFEFSFSQCLHFPFATIAGDAITAFIYSFRLNRCEWIKH